MNAWGPSVDALRDMRITRRRHRIADLEWFEALYRVYLAAFLGGGAILFLSGLVGDKPVTEAQFIDLARNGPPVVGVVMAFVCLFGARSGVNGGPLSIEEAEVRHVLLAPVPRATVLRRPFVQRLRSLAFVGALAGATCGQLLQRRVPQSDSPLVVWAMWGAVAGALIGVSFVVVAALVHVLRVPRWIATGVATGLLAWQACAAVPRWSVNGPFDTIGGIALWTLRTNTADLVACLVVGVGGLAATLLINRLSLEALARRSALVSQMRFAVTLQDIRTVVVLRRQLGGEHSRRRPWMRWRGLSQRDPVMRRSFFGMMRFPSRRILRMILLSIGAAVCEVFAWRGTAPMVVVSGMLLFVLGLDAVEPLSQEIDQPDRTDSLPIERGLLHLRLLIVPACILVIFVLVAITAAVVLEPSTTTLALGAIITPIAFLAGMAGAAVNVVVGAPDPLSGATSGLAMPPEVTGMTTVLRAAWPVAISVTGSLPVLSARWADEHGRHVIGTAVRSALAVCVVLGLVGGWIRQRDAIKAWFRTMQAGSRGDALPRTTGGQ